MKKVLLYRANDGKLFDTLEKAEAYTIDKICEEVNEILKTKHFRNLTYIDLIEIIKHLTGSLEKAQHLRQILNSYLDDDCLDED